MVLLSALHSVGWEVLLVAAVAIKGHVWPCINQKSGLCESDTLWMFLRIRVWRWQQMHCVAASLSA